MSRTLRIAVADDEPDMQEYFRRILPLLGHEAVVVAGTGEDLVERCARARPDLLITDIKMPGMSGLAAIESICAARPIPVIVISGHSGVDHVGKAYEQYVQSYLVKPVKRAHLEAAIEEALDRFEAQPPS